MAAGPRFDQVVRDVGRRLPGRDVEPEPQPGRLPQQPLPGAGAVADLADQAGQDPVRARSARGGVEGADVRRGGPQQPGEFRAFGLAPAGAHAADVAQPSRGALSDQHRAGQAGEPPLAGLPAADQNVLGTHVADLDPGPGADARFVHRIQPLADQALQAVLPGGAQSLGAVSDEGARGRPGGAGETEVLQRRAASCVREPEEGVALQVHQVEQREMDRDLRRPPRGPGG